MKKIILGALSVLILGVAGYFIMDGNLNSKQKQIDTPEKIVADYQDLQAGVERLQVMVGTNCDNKKDVNDRIAEIEKKLADLAERKKEWLSNSPKLPEIDSEALGVPGTQVPELSSDAPALPNFDPDSEYIRKLPELNPGRPGTEVPELSSDVPALPDIDPDGEYIPEMPELNPGRPGTEVPELSSDAPVLPDIDNIDVIDPNEPIFQMGESEQKIIAVLQALKDLCQDEKLPKKVISDKCTDACQKHKDCAAYTEDVTSADLKDAYDTCMEECPTWTKEIVKCINAVDIKTPNDCVSFVQCQLPQFYEEKYLQ